MRCSVLSAYLSDRPVSDGAYGWPERKAKGVTGQLGHCGR